MSRDGGAREPISVLGLILPTGAPLVDTSGLAGPRTTPGACPKLGEMAARHRPERTADDILRELIADTQREQAGDGD